MFSKTIEETISLAREANAPLGKSRELFSEDWTPSYRSPQQKRLNDYLLGLPEAELNSLLAVVYFGMGCITRGNMRNPDAYIRQRFATRNDVVTQVNKGTLAKLLIRGRERLWEVGIDVDSLVPPTPKSRSA